MNIMLLVTYLIFYRFISWVLEHTTMINPIKSDSFAITRMLQCI
jgi:hypothetical protein